MNAPFAATPTDPGCRDITRDFIARRAFDKWVRKGRPLGTDLQDWLEAEAELEHMRELAQQLAQANVVLHEVLEQSQQREQTLRQAEERYRSIFDNAVEGIFQTTREGRFLTANPALVRMLGFESVEDLTANVQDIGHQLHVTPETRCHFQRLLEERGHVQGFECQVYRKDGHILWVSLTARAVCDVRGAVRYFEGTAEDISERKRAEEALRHSEALYHTLVDNLPVCVLLKDVHGRFLFCNQAFCTSLKRSLADIVGKTDRDFYPPEMAQKYIYDDRRVIATREVLEAIEEHQDPEDCSTCWAMPRNGRRICLFFMHQVRIKRIKKT